VGELVKQSDVVFDTSVVIAFNLPRLGEWASVVVIEELAAGAKDKADIKSLNVTMKDRLKAGKLLVPDHEDWFQAGRILNAILRDEKRRDRKKQTPHFSEGQKQSLIRDVLIAPTAKQKKLTVVSDNKDFPLIQRYYEFDWISGNEFLNQ
jgi:predicted nucleic acid-binding protein